MIVTRVRASPFYSKMIQRPYRNGEKWGQEKGARIEYTRLELMRAVSWKHEEDGFVAVEFTGSGC